MLPSRFRLRRGKLIQATTRRGSYSRGKFVAAHYSWCREDQPPGVALAVGKPVGNAVVRNRVSRRLRHLIAERIESIPMGGCLVVRAFPSAATATSERLATDLDRVLPLVVSRAGNRAGGLA